MSTSSFPNPAAAVAPITLPSPQLSEAPMATTDVSLHDSDSNEDNELKELFGSSEEPEVAVTPTTTIPAHSASPPDSKKGDKDALDHSAPATDSANDSDGSVPSRKRKRQSSAFTGGSSSEDGTNAVITKKKQKVKHNDGDELPAQPIATRKQAKPKVNKHVGSIKKIKHIPIAPPALIKRAVQSPEAGLPPIKPIAPPTPSNMGKPNGGAHGKKKAVMERDRTSAPEAQRWTDTQDPNEIWLVVPTSKKWITMGSKTVAVSKILEEKHNYPQFSLVETIEGPHSKTGKLVAKAHKFRCEKMDDAQIAERVKAELARGKIAGRQAKRDGAALSRRRTRGGRVSKKSRV